MAYCPRQHRGDYRPVVAVGSEHQDLYIRMPGPDFSADSYGGSIGKASTYDHYIGGKLVHLLEALCSGGGFSHHFELVTASHHQRQGPPDDVLVLNNNNA